MSGRLTLEGFSLAVQTAHEQEVRQSLSGSPSQDHPGGRGLLRLELDRDGSKHRPTIKRWSHSLSFLPSRSQPS